MAYASSISTAFVSGLTFYKMGIYIFGRAWLSQGILMPGVVAVSVFYLLSASFIIWFKGKHLGFYYQFISSFF